MHKFTYNSNNKIGIKILFYSAEWHIRIYTSRNVLNKFLSEIFEPQADTIWYVELVFVCHKYLHAVKSYGKNRRGPISPVQSDRSVHLEIRFVYARGL